ncbi:hypothetical protein RD149_16180 [Gordonia westfalica]|uniref:SnoaL-like domain-containing protein n=1 Tax=Gordonia westfalica TaxID=158898 RepID=A0ABU2GV12_9ACTN|nr:hypothetical protein [Gordonia westfalica]MDS1115297.1 hypothetical protein [Gordonia westfalica]
MTTSPNRSIDFLIYTAKEVECVHGWVDDHLGSAGIADEQPDLDYLAEAVADMRRALREFTQYSDGRTIETSVEIEEGRGHFFHYTFKAVPEQRGERMLCEASRSSDPDEGDRGRYRVFADDARCTLRVELIEPGRPLRVVP